MFPIILTIITASCIIQTVGINQGHIGIFFDQTIEDYPYNVIIEHYRPNRTFCTGAIISEFYIVTVADCANRINEKSIVRSGSNQPWNGGARGGAKHWIDGYFIHPDWTGLVDGGIALIRVSQPFLYGHTRKSIGLFEKNERIKPGTIATVTGWIAPILSNDQRLQAINVTISDQRYFQDRLLGAIDNNYSPVQFTDGNEGDPLVVEGRLAGILCRWGQRSYDGKTPDGYIPIAVYREWIDNHVSV